MQSPDDGDHEVGQLPYPSPEKVAAEVNKRHTLNLLIQGAAAHTFLTAHHLVRDELEDIHPGLTNLYDRFSISGLLNYFIGDITIVAGLASRFWNRTYQESHPFFNHRLLREHGPELWRASKRHLTRRGWQKWVISIPIIHVFQMFVLFARVWRAERGHKPELTALAKRVASTIWGIDEERLDAEFTTNVAFGNIRVPKTAMGRTILHGAVGFGGVEQRDGRLQVVAKSWIWPLVLHELVKGTAELVCLHGLNTMSDELYDAVTDETDHIELETWMLQAGSEMWRRFLACLPPDQPFPHVLMHVARLQPAELERVMIAVVTDQDQARQLLSDLVRE